MRQIDVDDDSITDQPYKFDVYPQARKNQARYEALGEVITEHVYQMLLDAGLHKIYVPSPQAPNSSFVFGTKTSFENTKKLLILIHGSGVVRAGQWSRSLIINHSTDHGTQLPYIKKAIELGYEVLVTNTNNNYRIENGKRIPLEGNRSPEAHIASVWDQLIAPVYDTIEAFAVVAHSYGGVVTVRMADDHRDEYLAKCFAIGFTDSVHYSGGLSEMRHWFHEVRRSFKTSLSKSITFGMKIIMENAYVYLQHARNFVTSSKPLNQKLDDDSIPCYSAGHTKHEWTSWACMDALFPFLEEQYSNFRKLESKSDEEDAGSASKTRKVEKSTKAEKSEDSEVSEKPKKSEKSTENEEL